MEKILKIENTCRFCLKYACADELIPLFVEMDDNKDWRRIFSFVFDCENVSRNICKSCKVQINWIMGYYQSVFENDCYLRNEASYLAQENTDIEARTKNVNNDFDDHFEDEATYQFVEIKLSQDNCNEQGKMQNNWLFFKKKSLGFSI